MADLTNGSSVFQTYDNTGTGVAELGDNYAAAAGQGIAGRTVIVSVTGNDDTDMTQAEIDGFVFGVQYGETNGSPATTDAFTVVGIAGTAGSGSVVHFALQGTGTVQTTKGDYFTGCTATVVADFEGLQ